MPSRRKTSTRETRDDHDDKTVRPLHLRRLFALALIFGLVFSALGGRLVVLQVLRHEHYKDIVGDNTQRLYLKQPQRGDIVDARENKLATSIPVKRVLADPTLIHPYQAEVARAIAPLLAMSEVELSSELRLSFRTNSSGKISTNRFVNLHRKVTLDQWSAVTQALAQLSFEFDPAGLTKTEIKRRELFFGALRRKGIFGEDDYQRVYPSGHLASHVLGYVQEAERVFTNGSSRAATTDTVGVYGIERWLDNRLRGIGGWRMTETDRRQHEIVVFREQDVEPRPGQTAVLTLDMFIQDVLETQLAEAYRKFAPKSVCGMVVRPRTGEVLAMASLPDFDPNRPGDFEFDNLRNRVIADRIEPGSTFKIVVVSAALNEGSTTLSDVFYCEKGNWLFKGRSLRDHDGGYGDLTVEGIITKSSNIGAAKIAVYRLGEDKLFDYIRRFGFGQHTGINLDGEQTGYAPSPAKWDGLSISRIPMGHAIDVTHLQMVMAMAAIANEGKLMRPMLIKGLRTPDGKNYQAFQPQVVRQAITPETARLMITALKTVPAKGGTAIKAALDHYTVAGKTGTAQVPDPPRGYKDGKYIASFIGFFPADDPEVCISILVAEPDTRKGYYGGHTAAPFFKVVAEQVADYLKIKPDKEPPPSSSTPTPGVRPPSIAPLTTARPNMDTALLAPR
jgi:cell division protein FtsI/penicillin-binding protein 2